jgi:hypothetical protein
MIEMNRLIAVRGTTEAEEPQRKVISTNRAEKNPGRATFRFDCNPTTPPVVVPSIDSRIIEPGVEANRATADSVNQGAISTRTPFKFKPVPWFLLGTFVFFLGGGFVTTSTEGKVAAFVGALVWFYILFYSESAGDSSGPLRHFNTDYSGATKRASSEDVVSQSDRRHLAHGLKSGLIAQPILHPGRSDRSLRTHRPTGRLQDLLFRSSP